MIFTPHDTVEYDGDIYILIAMRDMFGCGPIGHIQELKPCGCEYTLTERKALNIRQYKPVLLSQLKRVDDNDNKTELLNTELIDSILGNGRASVLAY